MTSRLTQKSRVRLARAMACNDDEIARLSAYLRKRVFEICRDAKSGHIGGSSGAVELLSTLYFGGILRYSLLEPRHPYRDRVLVRGHLGPIRYPIFHLLGWIDDLQIAGYRKYGTSLQGHEDHSVVQGVDLTPSGSLGMVLSYGVGCALSARNRGEEYLTYVFIGDGEEEEGNVSEAARHASCLGLSNLIAIVDCNGKQLSNPTIETDVSSLEAVWAGYGWNVVGLKDGNDPSQVRRAYLKARRLVAKGAGPSVILARTVKGFGLRGAEAHFSGYHTTSTCDRSAVEAGIRKLEERRDEYESLVERIKLGVARARARAHHQGVKADVAVHPPVFRPVELDVHTKPSTPNNPDHCQGEYFGALKEACLGGVLRGERIYFLSADVTRRDTVDQLDLRAFCHYLNTGIREQHTLAMAHGVSLTDPSARIIINSFDAFMYRWMDQLNAALQGGSSMLIVADVAGITNGLNGKTHQSSGQPGAVLMMPGITFLEPWDAEDTFRCLSWAIGESRGVVYLRIHSSSVSTAVTEGVSRNISSYVAYEPELSAQCTIVASGLTVDTSIQAAFLLDARGVGVRVVNLINHKEPGPCLLDAVMPGRPVLTVYNGVKEVLLGNVASRLMQDVAPRPSSVQGMGFDIGTSGTVEDLKRHVGIDPESIAAAVVKLIS